MSMAIQALTNPLAAGATLPQNGTAAAQKTAAPFAGLLTDAVNEVNALQSQAQTAITGLMSGAGVDVHTAMIASEKASLAFELSLGVRNHAVQAYQQVMNMQF